MMILKSASPIQFDGTIPFIHLQVDRGRPSFTRRLFEKFERGHGESHVSGVGLGLAICRAIVHLHGGTIKASDRPGGGARFEIELPEGSI